MKNSDSFQISTQNIYCGYLLEPPRRGGPNVYPQSMFLSRNKKMNVYPCKPQFYCIKVGFDGVKTDLSRLVLKFEQVHLTTCWYDFITTGWVADSVCGIWSGSKLNGRLVCPNT